MNPEEAAIHKCRSDMQDLLSSGAVSLTWFTTELIANDFIDGLESDTLGVPTAAKVSKLIEAVQVQVRLDRGKFQTFLAILSKKPALQSITDRLARSRDAGEFIILVVFVRANVNMI